jgi:hypothetical protein
VKVKCYSFETTSVAGGTGIFHGGGRWEIVKVNRSKERQEAIYYDYGMGRWRLRRRKEEEGCRYWWERGAKVSKEHD